jgi:hypothetical protein
MYINIKIDNMGDVEELTIKASEIFSKYPGLFDILNLRSKNSFGLWFDSPKIQDPPIMSEFNEDVKTYLREEREKQIKKSGNGGSRRRRRSIPKSSRKFKKSSKRVFRKKSRSTRRR